jgi:hypothetical protein
MVGESIEPIQFLRHVRQFYLIQPLREARANCTDHGWHYDDLRKFNTLLRVFRNFLEEHNDSDRVSGVYNR